MRYYTSDGTDQNIKTVRQTSLLHIESNLDRLGLFSPTHGQRSQQQSGQITLQSPYRELLFFVFSVLVANPKKILYKVANPAIVQ